MARYIDVDNLTTHLKDEIKGCERPFGGRAWGKSVAYGTELGLKMALSYVETLPTANVQEAKEGEWTGSWDYACSVCNKTFEYKTPHCPHCGAKMKNGSEDFI
jgi:hypothetical protein